MTEVNAELLDSLRRTTLDQGRTIELQRIELARLNAENELLRATGATRKMQRQKREIVRLQTRVAELRSYLDALVSRSVSEYSCRDRITSEDIQETIKIIIGGDDA